MCDDASEVTNGVATKYYYFGKQRVALRTSAGVTYIHGDHLGSASATSGASVSSQTYYAYGNIRSTTGTVPTDFGFTGQRRDASAGLMDDQPLQTVGKKARISFNEWTLGLALPLLCPFICR